MKNKTLLLILTIISAYQFSFSQDNTETSTFKASDLIGKWELKYNKANNDLTFKKITTSKRRFGSRIEILKNGYFLNRYSAPCGNDSRLFTHNYDGKWQLNKDNWILTTSAPINRKGTVYKIVNLQSNTLTLSEIKSE